MRIGHGFDIHRFIADKPLVLGGVTIPFPQGMEAHSDGDVVIHAVCDALLGAAGLGDIGQHFPDNDPQFKKMDSRFFLRKVASLISEQKYNIANIDITIIAQIPKLAPYLNDMRENIAVDLKLDRLQVNLKATTMEKLDAVGRCEGIAVHAVTLIHFILI